MKIRRVTALPMLAMAIGCGVSPRAGHDPMGDVYARLISMMGDPAVAVADRYEASKVLVASDSSAAIPHLIRSLDDERVFDPESRVRTVGQHCRHLLLSAFLRVSPKSPHRYPVGDWDAWWAEHRNVNLAEIRAIVKATEFETVRKARILVPPPWGARQALDMTRFWNETSPRLSGQIVRVGPNGDYKEFKDALPHVKPGDRVRFGEGVYRLPRGTRVPDLLDVAFEGLGPGKTTLIMTRNFGGKLQRVRFRRLKIDCQNAPFISLHRGGSAWLDECHVSNYNSGAGGSNAIFGVNSILLVENCTFEGKSGRTSSGGGNAFDLRGSNLLFVKGTRFVGNDRVVSAGFPCAFDGCSVEEPQNKWGDISGGQKVLMRKSNLKLFGGKSSSTFTLTTADPAFVEYALGERKSIDADSAALAKDLHLDRNLHYWIGLLRHDDAPIRLKAAHRLHSLTGVESALLRQPSEAEIREVESSIQNLGSALAGTRDGAQRKLLTLGERARARLEETVEMGNAEEKMRAAAVLDSLDQGKVPLKELEHARFLKWFEENHAKLSWNGTSGKYVIKP